MVSLPLEARFWACHLRGGHLFNKSMKTIDRRKFLQHGLTGLGLAAAWSHLDSSEEKSGPAPKRPNVVFILTDDNSADELGYSSGGKILTPHIDALASDGVILDNFNCPASICTPSRYSFLTGVQAGHCSWPKFHEVWKGRMYCLNWFTNLEPGRPTIGSILRAAGYATGYTGKWHNGGVDPARLDLPGLTPESDPASAEAATALRQRYEIILETIRSYGFDWAASINWTNVDTRLLKRLQYHNLEWTVRGALDFLGQPRTGQPFYLQVNLSVPHGPHHLESLEADPRVCEFGYTDQSLTGFMPPRPTVIERLKKAGLTANHDTAGRLWMDDAVGAIVAQLKALGQFENTLLFVVADNGGVGGKTSCYERGVRLPALAHWPQGLPKGRHCDALLANIDLLPTVAAVCGARIPNDLPMDGIDRLAQMTGAVDDREELFLEIGYSRGLKTKRWKYIATRYPADLIEKMATGQVDKAFTPMGRPGSDYLVSSRHPGYFDQDQLYDLANDPQETNNLAQSEPVVLRDMQTRLRRHLDRIPFPYSLEKQPFLESESYRILAAASAADDSPLRAPYYIQERTMTR